MLRVLVRIAFFICSATTLLFSPTDCLSAWLTSLEYPPMTLIMILYCVTLYFGNLCFSSQCSGPYFAVFSSVFSSLFCIHGQLISSAATVSLSLSTIVASILLAFTPLQRNVPISHRSLILVHWFWLGFRVPWPHCRDKV